MNRNRQYKNERREFGYITIPFLIMMAILTVYIYFCIIIDVDRIQRQREEYLKHYTPRGERLTFGENEKLRNQNNR